MCVLAVCVCVAWSGLWVFLACLHICGSIAGGVTLHSVLWDHIVLLWGPGLVHKYCIVGPWCGAYCIVGPWSGAYWWGPGLVHIVLSGALVWGSGLGPWSGALVWGLVWCTSVLLHSLTFLLVPPNLFSHLLLSSILNASTSHSSCPTHLSPFLHMYLSSLCLFSYPHHLRALGLRAITTHDTEGKMFPHPISPPSLSPLLPPSLNSPSLFLSPSPLSSLLACPSLLPSPPPLLPPPSHETIAVSGEVTQS